MLDEAWAALGGPPGMAAGVAFREAGELPSAFPVADLAAASIAAAALAVAELRSVGAPGALADVVVDRRLAAMWFATSLRPIGWHLPSPWDAVAGDYRCRDGWIRLHTNAPRHRAAALRVLGAAADRTEVARAVAGRDADELEAAIVAAGGCAARMRSLQDWAGHPQGAAVRAEPLVDRAVRAADPARASSRRQTAIRPTAVRPAAVRPAAVRSTGGSRPLAGVRVLDLTRVLAGPIATRFLAGFGATVLRIDPPDWDEPAVLPETTLGKTCARLDLRSPSGLARLEGLLAGADLLLHGYRPGALDGLGLPAARRQELAPDLIEVCLDAYGWSGPWAGRRGFDSLIQMSSGIADTGRRWQRAEAPVPLPVQALDHATGYLMAAAAVRGLRQRLTDGVASTARCSLARTAWWLTLHRAADAATPALPAGAVASEEDGSPSGSGVFTAETSDDLAPAIEPTAWGPGRRLRVPLLIDGSPMTWARPAGALGCADAAWPTDLDDC